MYRIVVADDHPIVREGVRQVIAEIEQAEIVAEAEDGIQAIAAVKRHKPDLLVLDAAMPLARGIEVYADARRWSPDTAITLLTGFTGVNILADWLDAGVDGLLLKSSKPEEMRTCFETLLAGGKYVSEAALKILDTSRQTIALTNREREVLSLLVAGNINAAIAERLHISPKTVEKHRASLMQKLDAHSVTDLLIYALKAGLLDEQRQL